MRSNIGPAAAEPAAPVATALSRSFTIEPSGYVRVHKSYYVV